MFQKTHLTIIIEFIWNNVLSLIINNLAHVIIKYIKKFVKKSFSKSKYFFKAKINSMSEVNTRQT
jgi:hypothetical protein